MTTFLVIILFLDLNIIRNKQKQNPGKRIQTERQAFSMGNYIVISPELHMVEAGGGKEPLVQEAMAQRTRCFPLSSLPKRAEQRLLWESLSGRHRRGGFGEESLGQHLSGSVGTGLDFWASNPALDLSRRRVVSLEVSNNSMFPFVQGTGFRLAKSNRKMERMALGIRGRAVKDNLGVSWGFFQVKRPEAFRDW